VFVNYSNFVEWTHTLIRTLVRVLVMSSPKARVSWSFFLCIISQSRVLGDFITQAIPPQRSAYMFNLFSYSMIELSIYFPEWKTIRFCKHILCKIMNFRALPFMGEVCTTSVIP
jgi:hypothetical protein